MNERKPAPCPFCGHDPEISYRDVPIMWSEDGSIIRYFKVKCPECGAHIEANGSDVVIDRWNGLTRLDRCPICGGYVRGFMTSGHYHGDPSGKHYIQCDKCGLRTRPFDDELEARVFWNTRHGPIRKNCREET